MGYFSNLAIDVLDQHARGVKPEVIAKNLGLSVQEVVELVESDYDNDPAEYAEHSADLDAIHYGEV